MVFVDDNKIGLRNRPTDNPNLKQEQGSAMISVFFSRLSTAPSFTRIALAVTFIAFVSCDASGQSGANTADANEREAGTVADRSEENRSVDELLEQAEDNLEEAEGVLPSKKEVERELSRDSTNQGIERSNGNQSNENSSDRSKKNQKAQSGEQSANEQGKDDVNIVEFGFEGESKTVEEVAANPDSDKKLILDQAAQEALGDEVVVTPDGEVAATGFGLGDPGEPVKTPTEPISEGPFWNGY